MLQRLLLKGEAFREHEKCQCRVNKNCRSSVQRSDGGEADHMYSTYQHCLNFSAHSNHQEACSRYRSLRPTLRGSCLKGLQSGPDWLLSNTTHSPLGTLMQVWLSKYSENYLLATVKTLAFIRSKMRLIVEYWADTCHDLTYILNQRFWLLCWD